MPLGAHSPRSSNTNALPSSLPERTRGASLEGPTGTCSSPLPLGAPFAALPDPRPIRLFSFSSGNAQACTTSLPVSHSPVYLPARSPPTIRPSQGG